jgi:Cu2+-exporting ATPase
MKEISFKVSNMKCGGCVSTIETELIKTNGIKAVKADLTSSTVTISFEDIDAEELVNELKNIGYPVL